MAKRKADEPSRMVGETPRRLGGTRRVAGAKAEIGGTPEIRGAPQRGPFSRRTGTTSGHRSARATTPGKAEGRATPKGRKGAMRTRGLPEPKVAQRVVRRLNQKPAAATKSAKGGKRPATGKTRR